MRGACLTNNDRTCNERMLEVFEAWLSFSKQNQAPQLLFHSHHSRRTGRARETTANSNHKAHTTQGNSGTAKHAGDFRSDEDAGGACRFERCRGRFLCQGRGSFERIFPTETLDFQDWGRCWVQPKYCEARPRQVQYAKWESDPFSFLFFACSMFTGQISRSCFLGAKASKTILGSESQTCGAFLCV